MQSYAALSAEAFLLDHWEGETPVDTTRLCARVGVRVTLANTLGAGVKGRLRRDSRQPLSAHAELLEGMSEQVSRFVQAHQLGHVVLGHLADGAELLETAQTLSLLDDGIEAPANEFALALLMPKRTLFFAVERKGATTIDKLARLFGVSELAVYHRLRLLGMTS